MIAPKRLHALLALRALRERQAQLAWAWQAEVCAEQQRQLRALALEHRRQLDDDQARDAAQAAALLGRNVDRQQVQRYQAGIAEGIELDQYYVRQTTALTDQHTQAQVYLEALRQQRAARQRQCAALRTLGENADQRARLSLEWQEELAAEDLSGVRTGE
jgi:5-formyltetrahydrofolate cyclo-ligase